MMRISLQLHKLFSSEKPPEIYAVRLNTLLKLFSIIINFPGSQVWSSHCLSSIFLPNGVVPTMESYTQNILYPQKLTALI